jgi:adenosylhomocysteinase
MAYDVTNLDLAKQGAVRTDWAGKQMPVLASITGRFKKEKPLANMRIAACLHVTAETANLMRTLKAGGAEVRLCASNPLSTQDDVAAWCARDLGIGVFARRGEDTPVYYDHIRSTLEFKPTLTLDDGADLVSVIHTDMKELAKGVIAGMEETTTGVIRLRALEKSGKLLYPMFAVNDAQTKYLFDNRYGTGQSTVDGIIRATNTLFAGRVVVTVGYGWCGRGFASRARGLGARVVVCEVDPIKAIEAVMDGFEVMPLLKAAETGDIFCTLTGDIRVLTTQHFKAMKDGAIMCNSGHFNVEIDLEALKKMAKEVRTGIRGCIDEFVVGGRSLFVIAEGRLVNLAAAEGHPAAVMDMSFATQALMAEHAAKNKGSLAVKVAAVPREIEDNISTLKLRSMGVEIDVLTEEQRKYLSSWEIGT